jgi:hypothetical protein
MLPHLSDDEAGKGIEQHESGDYPTCFHTSSPARCRLKIQNLFYDVKLSRAIWDRWLSRTIVVLALSLDQSCYRMGLILRIETPILGYSKI